MLRSPKGFKRICVDWGIQLQKELTADPDTADTESGEHMRILPEETANSARTPSSLARPCFALRIPQPFPPRIPLRLPLRHPSRRPLLSPLRILLLFLPLLPVACGQGGGVEPPRVDTLSSGVVRLTHRALPDRPLPVDTLAVWNLWEPGAPYLFNTLADVAGGAESFYILDTGNQQVIQMSPQGTVGLVFGSEGSGPGELRYPTYLDVRNDRIWVGDVGNRRYSIFRFDGSLEDDRRWPGAARIVNPFKILPSGDVLHAGQWPLTVLELADMDPVYYLARFDLNAGTGSASGQGVADTLVVMPSAPYLATPMTDEEGQVRYPAFGPAAFTSKLHWAAHDGTVATVTSEEYRFELRDDRGRVRREVAAPTPDLRVTDAHKAWYFRAIFPRRFEAGEAYRPSAGARDRFPFAERRQALSGIAIDPAGRIWIEANLPEPGRSRLDLYDPEGLYLGHCGGTPLPVAFTESGLALIRERKTDGLDRYWVLDVSTFPESSR
jgi:hypothetical protein